jgi:hypothetical protein
MLVSSQKSLFLLQNSLLTYYISHRLLTETYNSRWQIRIGIISLYYVSLINSLRDTPSRSILASLTLDHLLFQSIALSWLLNTLRVVGMLIERWSYLAVILNHIFWQRLFLLNQLFGWIRSLFNMRIWRYNLAAIVRLWDSDLIVNCFLRSLKNDIIEVIKLLLILAHRWSHHILDSSLL